MGWTKSVTVIVVVLLTGLTGIAHGTPYNTWMLFSPPALHAIYWGSAPPPPGEPSEPPSSTSLRSSFRCPEAGRSISLTFGHADLAAAARAIFPAAGIVGIPPTGLQPCFSLLDGGAGPAALFDVEIPVPAPFPPAFLLLTSGFPGLGFLTKKALRRAADRIISRPCRTAHVLPAASSLEILSRCSRK